MSERGATALDTWRERMRKARESASDPAVGVAEEDAPSGKLRSRYGFEELSGLWASREASERMRVFVLAMLALDLGSREQTLFSVEAIAERFLDFLGDSLTAQAIGLALLEGGEIKPFAVRVNGQRAKPSELVTSLMRLAAERREPVMTPDVRHMTELGESPSMLLKPASVPAVAVPLLVSGEVVAVFYVDRGPGAAPLDADLSYLRMIAAVAAWPFRASRENETLMVERDRARDGARAAEKREREARQEAQVAQEAAREAREDAQRAREEVRQAREHIRQLEEKGHFKGIVGESPAILVVKTQMLNVAEVNTTLLLIGETGVGKTSIAAATHSLPGNPRRNGPFVAIEMTTIQESLMESELFGISSGSFTGATNKEGLVIQANHGTLFLDEIGELPKPMQAKLLRLLDKKTARKVGSVKEYEVDVRIIAATNRNLREMARRGEFREDLYYRLAQVTLAIPPLRERREDLPLLIDHVLKKARVELKRPDVQLDPEALALLAEYPWPGNVRELVATINSVVVRTRKPRIGPGDLPAEFHAPRERAAGYHEATLAFQRELVRSAMLATGGNLTRAAERLEIKQPTYLYQICRRLGLRPDDLREGLPHVGAPAVTL